MAFKNKIFNALLQTRKSITDAFESVIKQKISFESLEELEETLILADIGYETVESIMGVIKKNKKDNFINEVEKYLISILPADEIEFIDHFKSNIIMMVGVNGSGKTTSCAKLASYYKSLGKKVLLVAADTYRVAAVDQLKVWSKRLDLNIVSNSESDKPSGVLFDGLLAAKSQAYDIVIVDTAGRMHTHKNLMLELRKMYKIAEEKFSSFKISSFIALDANSGQNSLIQAKEFSNMVNIDGAILTKMDGTAKGGIVFPLFNDLNISVKFIGVGEDLDDIIKFDSNNYVEGILGIKDI